MMMEREIARQPLQVQCWGHDAPFGGGGGGAECISVASCVSYIRQIQYSCELFKIVVLVRRPVKHLPTSSWAAAMHPYPVESLQAPANC